MNLSPHPARHRPVQPKTVAVLLDDACFHMRTAEKALEEAASHLSGIATEEIIAQLRSRQKAVRRATRYWSGREERSGRH